MKRLIGLGVVILLALSIGFTGCKAKDKAPVDSSAKKAVESTVDSAK